MPFTARRAKDMRSLLLGVHALLIVIGGLCVLLSVVMFLRDSGSQIRSVDEIYDYVWFIGGLAIGVICLVIAALLSDKLKEIPSNRQ